MGSDMFSPQICDLKVLNAGDMFSLQICVNSRF